MGYITYKGRAVDRVKCKLCGELLREGGQPTPAYCGMYIAMREPDGMLSKHETPMCKTCKARLVREGTKPGELERLYAEDVEVWIEAALRAGHSAAETYTLADRQIRRTPLRILDEPGSYGE